MEERYIEYFAQQVEHYHDLLQEAYEGVINEGVSKYPVFIFHRQEVTVGLPIADMTACTLIRIIRTRRDLLPSS